MEPRNYESGASESAPLAPETPSVGYPTGGNPGTGSPATKPGPYWFYKIGEALRKVIVDAGLTPDDADLDQLNTAISNKVASKASQAEVDAGDNDTKFVTPQKLRWGFSILLANNGYIVFPSWLGGIILQWGSNSQTVNVTVPVTFPIAFTTSCLQVFSTSLNQSGTTNQDRSTQVGNFSTTGFDSTLHEVVAGGTNVGVSWLAVGF
jgi:hypothetical protein